MTSKTRNSYFSPPKSLLWEITLRCNFKCVHCAAHAGKPRTNELSPHEALAFCDQIKELGVPSVALMGGEPFLRKDWGDIAGKLRDYGIHVGMITNGYLFNDQVARTVEELGLIQVGISLDAMEPSIHDQIRGVKKSHESALRAIGIVNGMKLPHPTVITSINQYNLDQLHGIMDYLQTHTENFIWIINHSSDVEDRTKEQRWTIDGEGYLKLAAFINRYRGKTGTLNITGTHSLGYFSKTFDNLHDFKWQGCEAGRTALGVRSDGDVTGCLILPDVFIEGNIKTRTLSDIWNDHRSFSYTRAFDRRKLTGKCRKCEWNSVCKAGCTNHAYCRYGSIYESPYCLREMEQKEVEHVA